jgi:ribonuclease HI
MKTIQIYTDGACSGNPGRGGYGIVMKFNDKEKEISEGFRKTTNNRMELLAVIVALEKITTDKYPVEIYSDSKYVIDSIMVKTLFSTILMTSHDLNNLQQNSLPSL